MYSHNLRVAVQNPPPTCIELGRWYKDRGRDFHFFILWLIIILAPRRFLHNILLIIIHLAYPNHRHHRSLSSALYFINLNYCTVYMYDISALVRDERHVCTGRTQCITNNNKVKQWYPYSAEIRNRFWVFVIVFLFSIFNYILKMTFDLLFERALYICA
jgi:hypothetical protein